MGGITIYITWGAVIVFMAFFFLWIFYWFKSKNRKKCERLATVAHYVVADLLCFIDIDQNWDGWAREYREMFPTNPKSRPYVHLNTLAEGLNELSTLIKRTQ